MATINFASLRLAASEDIATFMKFAAAYNTYEIRCEKGLASDRAANKAYELLKTLQINTKENLGVIENATMEEKESLLDAIYAETLRATCFAA